MSVQPRNTDELAAALRDDESEEMLRVARNVLERSAAALSRIAASLDGRFVEAAETMLACDGRVVVTGMGKSGIVGRKISATFASTGTPSFFLHPAEAVHGDLGMLRREDVVLALSASGETTEILQLLPFLRLMAIRLVAIVKRADSTLGERADVCLTIPVESEGCPLELAPMASTTATLALGDALAAAVMHRRRFQPEDFALYHPEGSLGRRLLTTVRDLMISGHHLPLVRPGSGMREVLHLMVSSNLGAVLCASEDRRLLGILTDGDLKRLLDGERDFFSHAIDEAMTREPRTVGPEALAEVALRTMEENPRRAITVLPVVDPAGAVLGMIRMHDILKAKIR